MDWLTQLKMLSLLRRVRREVASAKWLMRAIHAQGVQIMSKISDFAAKVNEYSARQHEAINAIVADLQGLNEKIDQLQTNPGTISDEDQALLDQIQATGLELAERLESVDAMTPPTEPGVQNGGPGF